jgi:hypothetical protein
MYVCKSDHYCLIFLLSFIFLSPDLFETDILILILFVPCADRVTTLGDFSPICRLLHVFRQLKKNFFIHLKNTNYPQFMATCSMVKVTLMYINLTKNGLGHTLGDFITNSSVALVLSCHANLICPSTFGFSLPKQNFRHDFCATRKVECEQGDQIGRIFAYRAMVVFGQFSEN